MSNFPRATVETPFGTLEAWSTGPDHVGFSEPTGERGQTVYDDDGRLVATMVFNRIPHYVRIDFHPEDKLSSGARWGGHGWFTDWHYNVRRADRWTGDRASDSVNRKVQRELIPFLADWIANTPEGRKLVAEGSAVRLRSDIESARSVIETKQRELAEAEARLAELLAKAS